MSERYKKEIEEILRQAGDLGTGGKGLRRRQGILKLAWLQVREALGGKGWSLSPGRVMLIATGLLLSALVFRALVPGGIVALFAWGGLILFIVGYAMFFIRPKGTEKRWRGRPVDDAGEAWWQRWRRRSG